MVSFLSLHPVYRTSLLALGVTVAFAVPAAWAQTNDVPSEPPAPAPRFDYSVSIEAPMRTPVGRTVVLRAVTPDLPPSGTFVWDVQDGTRLEGVEVTHTFSEPGAYDIVLTHKLERDGAAETFTAKHRITVYRRAVVLFTLGQDTATQRALDDRAVELGTALTTFRIQGRTAVLRQQALEELLASEQEALGEADTVLFALPGETALPALLPAVQRMSGETLDGKLIVIADPSSTSAPRLARIVASAIAPSHVLLTTDAAVPLALEYGPATLGKELLFRDVPVTDVGTDTARPPFWALLSRMVDAMLERGIPTQTILLVLLVPLIVAVITFLRQVVGLNTMGLYVPVTMALAFVVLGPGIGILSVLAIFAAGIGVRALLRRVRLLYVARIGLATSLVTLLLLATLLASAVLAPGSIPNLAIFPILILTLITERTYNVIAERGLRSSLLVFAETTVVALVASVVAGEWEWLRASIVTWPEIALLIVLIQLLIGKYTGLRATELLRFRELLNEVEYAEEE